MFQEKRKTIVGLRKGRRQDLDRERAYNIVLKVNFFFKLLLYAKICISNDLFNGFNDLENMISAQTRVYERIFMEQVRLFAKFHIFFFFIFTQNLKPYFQTALILNCMAPCEGAFPSDPLLCTAAVFWN